MVGNGGSQMGDLSSVPALVAALPPKLVRRIIPFNGTLNAVNGEACLVVSGRPWVGTPGLSALAFLRFSTCRCLPFLLPSDGAAVF